MMDIMYFGYYYEDDSSKLKKEFKEEILLVFPDVELKNADDDIKGYRYEVHLTDEHSNDYYAWAFAHGWGGSSLTLQLYMMDKEEREKMDGILALTKQKYPDCFIPEALEEV